MSGHATALKLFNGNWKAHGTEQGGACHHLGDEWLQSQGWRNVVIGHFSGQGEPIGVYPMTEMADGWYVHWGCVDFDEGDEASWIHATNLHKVLQRFGITAWIERSRSKGYHVWVFLERWTAPELVRFALLAACQLVDAPTKEINPKQVTLAKGQLGNYVRLPYPGGVAAPGGRRAMVNERGWVIDLDSFLASAPHHLATEAQLEELRALYQEPVRSRPVIVAPTNTDSDPVRRLPGLAFTIWRDGPLDGSDRSGTLFKLAALIREGGEHTFSEALELVWEADGRWGKFHDRHNGYEDLTKVVEAAWR